MAQEIFVISSSDSDTDRNSDFEEPSHLSPSKRITFNHLSDRSSDSDCSLPDLSQRLLPAIGFSKSDILIENGSEKRDLFTKKSNIDSGFIPFQSQDEGQTLSNTKFTLLKPLLPSSPQKSYQPYSEESCQDNIRPGSQPSTPKKGSNDLTVVLEISLCQEKFYETLKDALETAGIQYAIETLPIKGTVCWRNGVQTNLAENQIVQYLSSSAVANMIHNFKNSIYEAEGETFLSCAQNIFKEYGSCQITFIILGMEKYFRAHKSKKAREFRNLIMTDVLSQQSQAQRKRKNAPDISEFDFQEAVVDLQLQANVNVRCVENAPDLASIVVSFTTSISDAPKKRLKQQHGFSWHVHGDSVGTVKVGKDMSNNLYELWVQQLLQFHQVSKDMAQAIASKYSSPQALIKAYRNCSTKNEASKLLQNIEVRRGIAPLSTSKRIGPELSYKIYTLLTTSNPDEILHTS